MTPGFPASFPFTVQCDWLIHTQLGTGLELRFLFFNLPTSQLPQSQIGRSPCIASNAFIEIHPSPIVQPSFSLESPPNSLEADTLSNSQRYCVTRNPERRMIIKSKAVWIHFSSGIHSSFLSSYFRRSSSNIRRPIGLKIHFKALPADSMILSSIPEMIEDVHMHPYIILGVVATSGFVLLILISCYVCMKVKQRKRNMGVVGGICRSTISTSPGGSSTSDNSVGNTPKKWRRNLCSLERTSNALNKNSFTRTGVKADPNQHNYEEIPALQRPIVPPRVTDPLMINRQVVRSESGPTIASYSNNKTRNDYSGRTATVTSDGGGNSKQFHSPPTYVSRHYMQIVCDAEGNCQYIPREEIEDSEVFSRPTKNNTRPCIPPLPPPPVAPILPALPRSARIDSVTNRFGRQQNSLPPVDEDSSGFLPPYYQAVKLAPVVRSPDNQVKDKVSRTKSSSSVSTV